MFQFGDGTDAVQYIIQNCDDEQNNCKEIATCEDPKKCKISGLENGEWEKSYLIKPNVYPIKLKVCPITSKVYHTTSKVYLIK